MPEFTSCLQNAYEFLQFTQVSGASWCLTHWLCRSGCFSELCWMRLLPSEELF